MALNIIRFPVEDGMADEISKKLQDDCVITATDSVQPQKPAVGNYKTKFLSCLILQNNDNNALQKARKQSDFIAVRGSSPEMCAWAANSKGVDLLLQPFSSEKCFLDMQTANVLLQNNVFVCVLFSDFLEADGFRLSQLIKNAAMCVKLCESAGVKMLFVSGARNESQMRAGKDLASFAVLLGLKKEAALKSARANGKDFLERLK
ncbi:MAG TPA: RNase P subunit p30 family protein [archaeon]|nr:RNase P subunit p30 family protein [archaeon]